MRVWHYIVTQGDHSQAKSAIRVLRSAGLEISLLNPDSISSPIILIFDKVTPQLFNFLRHVSRQGTARVMAIALSQAGLAGGQPWHLLQAGAADVLAWDKASEPEIAVVKRLERWESVDDLVSSPLVQKNLVGQSPAWVAVLRQVVETSIYATDSEASVLLLGETGTGKELAARLIHTLDPRPHKRDLVVLDCTTIVPELSGSEFFGHERGAFTGAIAARDGAFALADGGTLFLDEIGELPLNLQAQLLRVIQEGTFKRVGGNTWKKTVFRLICATNRDLLEEVRAGRFRRDLYYRIASLSCKLPPLRDRQEDILKLATHFMGIIRPGEELPTIDDHVRSYLLRREYPGNIRDLKQLMTRIMFRCPGKGPITVGNIPEDERPLEDAGLDWLSKGFVNSISKAVHLGMGLREIRETAAETAINIAIKKAEGNLQSAAQALGVTPRTLQIRRANRRQKENHLAPLVA